MLINAVPPFLQKTEANPNGFPIEVIDQWRASIQADRHGFMTEFRIPFFGFNRPGAKVSQGLLDNFLLQSMLTSLQATYACIKAFAQTDFTEDLKKFDVPTLIMHGDDDQVVPIAISALISAKLVKGALLKVYPGLPHGMCSTHKDLINADLLEFIKAEQSSKQAAGA